MSDMNETQLATNSGAGTRVPRRSFMRLLVSVASGTFLSSPGRLAGETTPGIKAWFENMGSSVQAGLSRDLPDEEVYVHIPRSHDALTIRGTSMISPAGTYGQKCCHRSTCLQTRRVGMYDLNFLKET